MRQTIGTLNSINSKFVNPLKNSCIFVIVILCDYSWTVQNPATLKITIASSPSCLITESVNSKWNRTPRPTAPPRALCAFQTHRTVWFGSPSLATMLKNHCQPCGGQEVLCYATSPHGLIPLIKRSRVPGHGYSNTAYLSFIIKAVAAERVAECGRLLPKNSVFPIYSELHCALSSGSKVADVCQNRLLSLPVEIQSLARSASVFLQQKYILRTCWMAMREQ